MGIDSSSTIISTRMGMAQLLWVRLSDYMDDFGIDPGGWLCDCAVIKSAHSADC